MQETRKAVNGDCIELISVVAYKTVTGLVLAKTGERFHVSGRNKSDDGVKTTSGVNVLDTEYKIVDEAQEPSEQLVKVKWTPAFQSYHSVGDEAEPFCGGCETYLQDDFNYCPGCGFKLDWGDTK
ncbi:hypothetical protein B4086_5698 [Bacillus cereus]|nr:hypothetical protein B4086_5698 [Bacillus cereus]